MFVNKYHHSHSLKPLNLHRRGLRVFVRSSIHLLAMSLLDQLWDDTVAGPRPDKGLGKLRKQSTFSFRSSDSGKGTLLPAAFELYNLLKNMLTRIIIITFYLENSVILIVKVLLISIAYCDHQVLFWREFCFNYN